MRGDPDQDDWPISRNTQPPECRLAQAVAGKHGGVSPQCGSGEEHVRSQPLKEMDVLARCSPCRCSTWLWAQASSKARDAAAGSRY